MTGSGSDPCLDEIADGVAVRIHARPGARRAGVVGRHGDALKVAVRAAPEKGRANDELCETLAALFGVGRREVRLLSGATHRAKRFAVQGTTLAAASRVLAAALQEPPPPTATRG